MAKIDYSSLFDKLNDEIIKNDDLASAYMNRMVDGDTQLPLYVAIDNLLQFLDYFSNDNTLDITFTLLEEAIIIEYGRNPIIIDEVYSVYDREREDLLHWLNNSVGSSQDLLDEYYRKRHEYNHSRRGHNKHLNLLQSLFSSFPRIDFTLDGSIYSWDESHWGGVKKKLPWQFMPFRIDSTEYYNPSHNLFILHPKDTLAAITAFKSLSPKRLLFLNTNQVEIKLVEREQQGVHKHLATLKKSIVFPNKLHDLDNCKEVSFCCLNQQYGGDTYWAVLFGENTPIPEVSRRLFLTDPKTPAYLNAYTSIHVDFAIRLTDDYHKGLLISNNDRIMLFQLTFFYTKI